MRNPFMPVAQQQPPQQAAQPQINKPTDYFNPYYQAGNKALQQYQDVTNRMLQHPEELENTIMQGYQMSPYAKYQTQQTTEAANRAAAAAGELGTPNEQAALARQIQGITSADEQQYLQNAMQPYMSAYQGLGGITQMGYGSAGQMANIDQRQRELDEQLAEQRRRDTESLWGGLAGAGAKAAGEIVPWLL